MKLLDIYSVTIQECHTHIFHDIQTINLTIIFMLSNSSRYFIKATKLQLILSDHQDLFGVGHTETSYTIIIKCLFNIP